MEETDIQGQPGNEPADVLEGVPPAPAEEVAGAADPPPAAEELPEPPGAPVAEEPVSADELLSAAADAEPAVPTEDLRLKAVLEAVVYIAEEPLSLEQIAGALGQPAERIRPLLGRLVEEYDLPGHGLTIREVAGGYKMATKAEHHEAVRNFVKNLKPPLKLSLAALETLAVIAYKQPVTAPEIMEIRGVQGAGVLKTLLDRKLIAAAGRKNVIGKPILYKTTRDFLVQFGLKDLAELPTLKEFEEIGRMALGDDAGPEAETVEVPPEPSAEASPESVEALPEAPEPSAAAVEDPPAGQQPDPERSAPEDAGVEQPQ